MGVGMKGHTMAPLTDYHQSQSQSQSPIPLYYRLPLLYIEPICALGGAYMLLSCPNVFLNSVSPNHDPSLYEAASSPASQALARVRIVTDMLGIMHLVFAFNLTVVLRAIGNDRRLWRVISAGMLLSDCLHLATTIREFGWDASFDPGQWRSHEWINFGTLWSMTLVRVGVVLGIGLGEGSAEGRTREDANGRTREEEPRIEQDQKRD